MKTSQIINVIVIGLGFVCFSSCGFKKEKITQLPPIKVTIMPVSDSGNIIGRTYSGTVESGEGAEVSFTIPGTVEKIYASAGDEIKKGQLLAELKSGTLQNSYNIAKATLAEAQDAYDRFKKLHDAKALADMRWVEIENTLKQAQNAEEIARRAMDDARLYSPISGTVSEKLIDVGQTVIPAVAAFKIVALNDVKVTIPIPENEIANLSVGQNADIVVEALNNEHISGKLTEKGIVANPLTRAYEAKFSVENPNGKLLPGMICNVSIQADSIEQVIVLPPQSVLLSADNRNFVWLARDSKAHQQFVEASDITAEGIVISSGLERGDSVIIAGMQKVSEGTQVEPQL